jgi:hypothetical protein
MLYIDSEKRIGEINRVADLFASKGYPRTEKVVRQFSEILKGDKIPNDFLAQLISLFDIHQKEFELSLPVGQNYRKRCYEEIKTIVFEAIGRMQSDFAPTVLTIYPLFPKLNSANTVIGLIMEQLAQNKTYDKSVVFYLRCYAYLVLVEGVFDELARILYFLSVLDKSNIPKLKDLEEMSVWKILEALQKMHKATPVFLEKWEEKNHIRNSIGHARVEYNTARGEVRFIDIDNKTGKLSYDSGYISTSKFSEMTQELGDSLIAFSHVFLLLKIYDFVAVKSAFV